MGAHAAARDAAGGVGGAKTSRRCAVIRAATARVGRAGPTTHRRAGGPRSDVPGPARSSVGAPSPRRRASSRHADARSSPGPLCWYSAE